MKARLFTSLSNGLSGVKSRAFSLRRAGFRTKCNLHFPERLLHPEQMLTPSEEETFFIPTFSEKASVHKLVHFNRAATGNYQKELKKKKLYNYLFVITRYTLKRESRSIESKTTNPEPNANSGRFFHTDRREARNKRFWKGQKSKKSK